MDDATDLQSSGQMKDGGPSLPPFTSRFLVIDDFLPLELANAMRQAIDDHFSKPHKARPDVHQVWNYWFVPGLYTYLRTQARKVIPAERVDEFVERLTSWSTETLGLSGLFHPNLSLYVDGCRQGLHNDARNGRFGYVYSLTKDDRRTQGGETLVFHDGDPVRRHIDTPAASPNFYDAIAPRFNRLVVFDDRQPHAVEPVYGSMDPHEGRFVLHGHIVEDGPVVSGALQPEDLFIPAIDAAVAYFGEIATPLDVYHGPVSIRMDVSPEGRVTRCGVIMDRVLHREAADSAWSVILAGLVERLRGLTFPTAAGESRLIVPFIFGGSLDL